MTDDKPLTPDQLFQKRKALEDALRRKNQVSARIVEKEDDDGEPDFVW